MKNIPNLAVLFFKGFVLGLSMALPGLSGGTMAFIMGVYEKLIQEISKAEFQHIKKLFSFLTFIPVRFEIFRFYRGKNTEKLKPSRYKKQEIKEGPLFFWSGWDWAFLIPLAFGALCSGILFVVFAPSLIEEYSLQFYSLICGLALASVWRPFREIKKNGKNLFIFFLSFTANFALFLFGESFSLFSGSLFSGNEDLVFLIFLPVGFLVSSALIVPGLSGSYLLVLFGLYERALSALKEGEWPVIICLSAGALAGIFSIAKLIRRMLENYFDESMAVISGLILSGLYAIYPLPKESFEEVFSFDAQAKIFWLFSASSFILFMGFNFLYERKKAFSTSAA